MKLRQQSPENKNARNMHMTCSVTFIQVTCRGVFGEIMSSLFHVTKDTSHKCHTLSWNQYPCILQPCWLLSAKPSITCETHIRDKLGEPRYTLIQQSQIIDVSPRPFFACDWSTRWTTQPPLLNFGASSCYSFELKQYYVHSRIRWKVFHDVKPEKSPLPCSHSGDLLNTVCSKRRKTWMTDVGMRICRPRMKV